MVWRDYAENIRNFNRFYTRIIGVNNQYTDKTKYSSTEAQLLYEISIKKRCSAAYLCNHFGLDKGYLSRILKRFEIEKLIIKSPSEVDKRIFFLHLTEKGKEELQILIESANQIVRKMVTDIPKEKIDELIESMKKIQAIFIEYKKE